MFQSSSEPGRFSCSCSRCQAHATGTPLGDPIEMGAIVKAAVPLALAGILPLNCTKARTASLASRVTIQARVLLSDLARDHPCACAACLTLPAVICARVLLARPHLRTRRQGRA